MLLQLAVAGRPDDERREFAVYSRPDGFDLPWVRHAEGVLTASSDDVPAVSGDIWPPAGASEIDLDGVYDRLTEHGYGYGDAFQGLRRVWRRDGDVFAEVALPASQQPNAASYLLHPALLDAALHPLLPGVTGDDRPAALPFTFSGYAFTPRARARCGSRTPGPARRRCACAPPTPTACPSPASTSCAGVRSPATPRTRRSGRCIRSRRSRSPSTRRPRRRSPAGTTTSRRRPDRPTRCSTGSPQTGTPTPPPRRRPPSRTPSPSCSSGPRIPADRGWSCCSTTPTRCGCPAYAA
ncbi:polyketide synthase dehydratase domain-containing protein [Catellatospora coxensis]